MSQLPSSSLRLRRTDSMSDQVYESESIGEDDVKVDRVVWIKCEQGLAESVFQWLRDRCVSEDFIGPVNIDGQIFIVDLLERDL